MAGGSMRGRVPMLVLLLLLVILNNVYYIKASFDGMVENVERYRLERLTAGYSVRITDNFRIKFAKGDADIVDRVAEEAERQLGIATGYFGYLPEGKITLFVHPEKGDMEEGLRLPSKGTTLGAYYAGTISILSPNHWGEAGLQAEEGLYLHELTHLIMKRMAGGNYPVWFTEGMALYQEYVNTGFEWGADHIFRDFPYSVKELSGQFTRLDQFLAYRQSFLMVREIMERNDREDILRLLEMLKEGETFEAAFEKSLGYAPGELQRGI